MFGNGHKIGMERIPRVPSPTQLAFPVLPIELYVVAAGLTVRLMCVQLSETGVQSRFDIINMDFDLPGINSCRAYCRPLSDVALVNPSSTLNFEIGVVCVLVVSSLGAFGNFYIVYCFDCLVELPVGLFLRSS